MPKLMVRDIDESFEDEAPLPEEIDRMKQEEAEYDKDMDALEAMLDRSLDDGAAEYTRVVTNEWGFKQAERWQHPNIGCPNGRFVPVCGSCGIEVNENTGQGMDCRSCQRRGDADFYYDGYLTDDLS